MTLNCTGFGNDSLASQRCGSFADQGTNSLTFSSIGKITGYSIIYGLISLVALVGNTLVCFVIIKIPGMRTVTNVFLLNLALADILFIVVTVPPWLAMEILPNYWLFGEVLCKTIPFLNTVTLSTSIYTMVVLAIDRYYAILHPFRAKIQHTVRRTFTLIILTWILSSVVAAPQIPAQTLLRYPPEIYCLEDWRKLSGKLGKQIYTVVIFCIFFAVPITIITIAYTAIIRRLRNTDGSLKETFRMRQQRQKGEGTNGKIDERSATISGKNRKTTFMMLTVILAFLICMLPLNVLLLVNQFLTENQKTDNQELIRVMASILGVLATCSSACNPIIYNFFSLKFRKAFADVFRCKYEKHTPRGGSDMTSEFNRL